MDKVLLNAPTGQIVASHGMIYPLTPCCKASATGTEYGTACRSCYQEIDPMYGFCAVINDANAHRDLEMILDWAYNGKMATMQRAIFASEMLAKAARK